MITEKTAIELANKALGKNAIERFGEPEVVLVKRSERLSWLVRYPRRPQFPASILPGGFKGDETGPRVFVDHETGEASYMQGL